MRTALSALLSLLPCASVAQWQPGVDVSGLRQTAPYAYGVGRLEWNFPRGLPVFFAVPHFTAGPRILCGGEKPDQHIPRCEVEVHHRVLQTSREERQSELLTKLKPHMHMYKEQVAEIRWKGKDLFYVVLERTKSDIAARYFVAGIAHRSTAMLRFQAELTDLSRLPTFLDLIAGARAVDALEMWAWRLRDYGAVCADLHPELAEENTRAYTASVFAAVNVEAFFLRYFEAATPERIDKMLDAARRGFAADFGKTTVDQKRALCTALPKMIAEAASEL